jgi:aryl-alcohol dehydrogenase
MVQLLTTPNKSKTTVALVVSSHDGLFEAKEVQLKDMRHDEILVRMIATGVCHTDIGSATGKMGPTLPAVLGHEGAGVVEEIGASVHHVAIGDHVLLSITSCGACRPCLRGLPSYCRHGPRLLFGGARSDGSHTFSLDSVDISSPYFGQSSFAARSIVTANCAVSVPKDVPLDVLCPFGCGFQTGAGTVLNDLKPYVGASIAVFGVGSVGLAAIIAAANLTPATKIIAVDVMESRLELAAELGATETINSSGKDVVALIKAVTAGEGVDRALDTTGNTAIIEAMIASAANNGVVATVGAAPAGKFVSIEPADWIGRNVSYVGSCEGSSHPQTVCSSPVHS